MYSYDFYLINLAAENQPPIVLCKDVTVSAGKYCEATVNPEDVDNGSYDPDSDPITFSLDPSGPYCLGQTTVILTVSDGQASSSCTAIITVVDEEPPTITCPANTESRS